MLGAIRVDLLDLLGVGYLSDLLWAAIDAQNRDDMYRIYASDMLCCIARGSGGTVERRYYDILHPPKEDRRTAEEIGEDFMARHGLTSHTKEHTNG